MLQQLQRLINTEFRRYVLTEGRTKVTHLCNFWFERATITGQNVVLVAVKLRLNV